MMMMMIIIIIIISDGHQAEAVAWRCSVKKLAKFTGKHLCQSFFFNKVAGPKG